MVMFLVQHQRQISAKAFDDGSDLPKYTLTINLGKDEHGFKLSGKLEPQNTQVAEAFENKIKKQKRIETVKRMLKKKK